MRAREMRRAFLGPAELWHGGSRVSEWVLLELSLPVMCIACLLGLDLGAGDLLLHGRFGALVSDQ